MLIASRAVAALALVVAMCASGSAGQQGEYALDPHWPTYHAKDLREWARKSGLSVARLKELLRAAGREDDYDYYIGKVDSLSLKKRGQVFLSTYDFGTGAALTAYVIDTRTPYYEKVWQAAGTADTDFVTDSMLGRATASVGRAGTIVVMMPDWNGKVPMSHENSDLLVFQYVWTGTTYRLQSATKFPHYKWNGTDWEVLPK